MKVYWLLSLFVGFCVAKPQEFMFGGGGGDLLDTSGFTAPQMLLENMMGTPAGMMGMVDPSELKTKTKVQKKGNMTITETNKTGPNFYMQEVEVKGGSNKASLKDLANFSPFLLGGAPLSAFNLKKKNTCKNCKSSQFCMDGICVDKKKEGALCLTNKECKKALLCVFGVCNKAEEGEAGTQCKKHDECSDDLCCFSTKESDIKECSSRLPKGAICDQSPFSSTIKTFLPFPFRKKRGTKSCSNPCQDGLKCAINGDGMEKKCVPKNFKFDTAPKDESSATGAESNDNNNNDDGSTDGDDDDNKDDDDNGKIEVTTGDGETVPGSISKNNNNKDNKGKKNKNEENKQKSDKSSSSKKHKKEKQKDQHIKF